MTIMYNMLKMKKMNGLKIFTLVLLSLSKFETMFGMKEKENENEDEINDEYVNKNYYLIDFLGNKITLDNDDDIKFKINNEEIDFEKDAEKYILTIKEKEEEKILADKQVPLLCIDNAILVGAVQNKFILRILPGVELGKKTLQCSIVKKIGEDSIKDDYILVDAENNKIEKINGKNIVFKLLTRKKCLDLNEKLKDSQNYLKKDEEKYILDNTQKPLLFEKVDNDLILYVRRSENKLWLANWLFFVANINFNKDNSIVVRMAKKEEIDKNEEKKVENDKIDKKEGEKVEKKEILKDEDSSKCCCGIC